MSLIHKKTFDILEYCEEGKEDEYFEVDENIALVISALNKKGYVTTFCCSGHAFAGINDYISDDKDTLDCIIFSNLLEMKYEDGKYKAKDRINTKDCYICFAESYSFPELPKGFIYYKNDKRIDREYVSESDTYDLIYEIVDSMKALYEWALKLEPLV